MENSNYYKLKELYDKLLKTPFAVDDGCDDGDAAQNAAFSSGLRNLNKVASDIRAVKIDGIDTDNVWADSWEGISDRHLPESIYAHAVAYCQAILNINDEIHPKFVQEIVCPEDGDHHISHLGFRFAPGAEPSFDPKVKERWGENRFGNNLDCLYDGFESVFKADNGKYYTVMFDYQDTGKVPAIWLEVVR